MNLCGRLRGSPHHQLMMWKCIIKGLNFHPSVAGVSPSLNEGWDKPWTGPLDTHRPLTHSHVPAINLWGVNSAAIWWGGTSTVRYILLTLGRTCLCWCRFRRLMCWWSAYFIGWCIFTENSMHFFFYCWEHIEQNRMEKDRYEQQSNLD